MLDLKNKDLHIDRKEDMEQFLDMVVVTKKDRERVEEGIELDDTEEDEEDVSEEDIDSFLNLNVGEDGSLDISNLNSDGIESLEDEEEDETDSIFKPLSELGTPYEKDSFWVNILVSPYYLFYYMIRSFSKTFRDRRNWNLFLNSLWKVSGVNLIFTLFIMYLFEDVKFIVSMPILTIVSAILFVPSFILDKIISIDGVLDSLRHKDLINGLGKKEENEENAIIFEEESEDSVGIDNFEDLEGINVEDILEENEEEEFEEVQPVLSEEGNFRMAIEDNVSDLPDSPIDIDVKYPMFLNQLSDVYDRNSKYRGVSLEDREEVLNSFSDYLISNDRNFGKWDEVEDYSVEFNNLLYSLYLALIRVNNRFRTKEDEDNKIYVKYLRKNPLMYKLEVELPEYLGVKQIQNNIRILEDSFRSDESDVDVSILVAPYQQSIVFKFFLPVSGLISLGDILRYRPDGNGEIPYDGMIKDDGGLPILLGLMNNEFPSIVDFADNTSMVIVGESGSGKSWGTFLIMLNIIVTNSYNDAQFVIMDRKKSLFWKNFSRLPHVVGYHTNVPDYFDILKELSEEMEERKLLLESINQESWKGLRKSIINKGRQEELGKYPWLIVILDEMTNTLAEVRAIAGDKNKHIYDSFVDDLTTIAQEGRSLGIKLVSIGQRATDKNLPKSVLSNSSLNIFFKVTESDYNRAFSEEQIKNVTLPKQKGQAVVKDQSKFTDPVLIRTLTLGGKNDDQIASLIRILSLEWTRRSMGVKLTEPLKLDFTYNRDVIRKKVLKDVSHGVLFPGEIDYSHLEGYDQDNDEEFFTFEKEDDNGNILETEEVKDTVYPMKEVKITYNEYEEDSYYDEDSYQEEEIDNSNESNDSNDSEEEEYIDDLDFSHLEETKSSIRELGDIERQYNEIIDDEESDYDEEVIEEDVEEVLEEGIEENWNFEDTHDKEDVRMGISEGKYNSEESKIIDSNTERLQRIREMKEKLKMSKVKRESGEDLTYGNREGINESRVSKPLYRNMVGNLDNSDKSSIRKEVNKETVRKVVSKPNNIVKKDRVYDNKLPIDVFIDRYGVGKGVKTIDKEIIRNNYSESEIRKALDNIKIIDKGDYYQN